MNNLLRITHSREILCTSIQSLKGATVMVKYTIPMYNEKLPNAIPKIEIKDGSIILTYINPSLQQTPHQPPDGLEQTVVSSHQPTVPGKTCT